LDVNSFGPQLQDQLFDPLPGVQKRTQVGELRSDMAADSDDLAVPNVFELPPCRYDEYLPLTLSPHLSIHLLIFLLFNHILTLAKRPRLEA
jgi:hypothetical protein